MAVWSTTAAGLFSGLLILASAPNILSAFLSDVDFPFWVG